MRAQCSSLKKIWYPSRTLRTQELQNASAVSNSEEDLAPLSHFMGFGFPKGLPNGLPEQPPGQPKKAIPESLPGSSARCAKLGKILYIFLAM